VFDCRKRRRSGTRIGFGHSHAIRLEQGGSANLSQSPDNYPKDGAVMELRYSTQREPDGALMYTMGFDPHSEPRPDRTIFSMIKIEQRQ
jgi:hypothetical protein